MTKLVIRCNECSTKWEILERDNFNNDINRFCPNCGKSIDDQTWKNQIIPGFCQISDANRELVKDALNRCDQSLFSIEVIGQNSN